MQWVEPYGKSKAHTEPKSNFSGNLPLEGGNNISTSIQRLSVSQTTNHADPGSDELITCELFFGHLTTDIGCHDSWLGWEFSLGLLHLTQLSLIV